MPTIYLYEVEEQIVQQIGSAGLPATLQLRVSPDADVQLYDVAEGTPSSIAVIHTIDIELNTVIDDTPPKPDPIRESITIYLFAGEIPYIVSSVSPLIPATLLLRISPDADVQLYDIQEQTNGTERYLSAVDIFVRPVDYFIEGGDTLLTVQEAVIALTTDGIVLVQEHILIVQESVITLTTDGVVLIQECTLVVQEAVINLTTDSILLLQNHILAVQEAEILLTADNVDLSVTINLIVAFAIIQLISDNVTLGSGLPTIIMEGDIEDVECFDNLGDVNLRGNIFTIR